MLDETETVAILSVMRPGRGPVPVAVQRARRQILKAALGGGPCLRCEGDGIRDDSEEWVVTDTGHKSCFTCHGSGIQPRKAIVDPYKVRYSFVARLVPLVTVGNIEAIQKLERSQQNSIFWPVLQDVFDRALNAAEKNAGM